ncbi:MAG: IS200/IS605 family transposase [Anaerolineae bacterium]|nr:IS200/IS605 family transposase [Anaerolineae bacterium]
MSYWRMFYHVTWATKRRESVITTEMEAVLFPVIVTKSCELGAIVYALNGTMDHVHLAVAIPPSIGVGDFVGQVKGRATYAVNKQFACDFGWQTGYGVHTFGEKQLSWVIDYVEHQKEHHAAQTPLQAALEMSTSEDDGPPYVLPE